jgi:hypothetical protein
VLVALTLQRRGFRLQRRSRSICSRILRMQPRIALHPRLGIVAAGHRKTVSCVHDDGHGNVDSAHAPWFAPSRAFSRPVALCSCISWGVVHPDLAY